MKTKATSFAGIAISACIFFAVGAAAAAELPRAQLDEAERYFTEAYLRFLNRDYWATSDYLDRALKANTYLVDYYLMKGLTLNRTGDYGAGRESLAYYLEVRPMDFTAPRILSYAIGQQRELRRVLGTSMLSSRWQVSRLDLQTEFELGAFRPFNVKGMGKVDAWGSTLCVTDTLGNRVDFLKKSTGKVRDVAVDSPAVTLPLGDDSFYVLTASGDVHVFAAAEALSPEAEPPSDPLTFMGSLENTVADAALFSASEFAVADPVARETAFYSLAAFSKTESWTPTEPSPEEGSLFEPVGLAAYGPWLAVADRGGNRVFFLNAINKRDFFFAETPRPRDVAWSAIGELFVIDEDGNLFKMLVDFRDRRVDSVDLMESGLENGWTLFASPEGDLYCLDISASKLWKAVPIPDVNASLGFLSVARPRVTREENKESFALEANLMSPFVTYSKTAALVVHAVWNNKTIPSFAERQETPGRGNGERKAEILVFHRPAPLDALHPALREVVVENGTDIQIALPSIWTTQRRALTNVVVDASIIFSQEELDALTLFCLNNGVELDVWARSVPAVEMVRAAALSGGKVLFSLSGTPDVTPPRGKMQIRIPLPQELSSSGYPSRSMLTVYLDIGLMHTKDWIPLWPDMLE
ncbi:MAG: hypothetical protein LBQ42_03135 [Synergistaceae bacterium]|jgi:hypothetical protein|nr:hypothetical protein [Synergistaceae bacterium]